MKDTFLSLDMFGAPMPSLHIRGDPVVKTSAGACISIIVIGLTSLFALLKLQFMLMRSSPDVNKFVNDDFFDISDRFKLDDEEFMFAVSVEHYYTGIRTDPRYVKWVAEFI